MPRRRRRTRSLLRVRRPVSSRPTPLSTTRSARAWGRPAVQPREEVLHSAVEAALSLRGRLRLDERVVTTLHLHGELERAGSPGSPTVPSNVRARDAAAGCSCRSSGRSDRLRRARRRDGRSCDGSASWFTVFPGSVAASRRSAASRLGLLEGFVESRRNWISMAQSPGGDEHQRRVIHADLGPYVKPS